MSAAEELYSSDQLYLGNGDAFRHAYWNASLVKAMGSLFGPSYLEGKALHGVERATAWTTAHEQNSSGIDKQMDLHNNNVGRYHAYITYPATYETLKSDILRMVGEGQMVRIVNGKLTATNSTK